MRPKYGTVPGITGHPVTMGVAVVLIEEYNSLHTNNEEQKQ
jgi:hypothetical protein